MLAATRAMVPAPLRADVLADQRINPVDMWDNPQTGVPAFVLDHVVQTLSTIPDNDKLMRNEATGALIAVIGDDNDEFILVGPRREFVAQRDGVLFLGVNEGDLTDNTGSYDIVIEAEAGGGSSRP